MKRSRAFTLIELLMVISIIALLIGIAIVGFARVGRSAQAKQTRGQMEILVLMLSNYHDISHTIMHYPGPVPIPAPGSVADGGADRLGNPVQLTDKMMNTLKAVLGNAKLFGQIGADKLLLDISSQPSVVLDAWHNPIIYVPQEGLTNVKTDGGTYLITSTGKLAVGATPGLEARPFWASAGPDGNFASGDDNIYSFDD